MQTPYPKSAALFEDANRIIPGGIHLSGRPLLSASNSPLYFDQGFGGRCVDVDGNEYIDLIMAFGPFLLGYANAEVDNAAFDQIRRGALLSMNHPLHLQFVQKLLGLFPSYENGVFFKTGSEATTAALRIARKHTRRRKIVRCGYHGWHDWCLPLEPFVPEGLAGQIFEFSPQVPGSLEAILYEHGHDVAAVIMAPEMVATPTAQKFHHWMQATASVGAVFILDEVKTAFRSPGGSVQAWLNLNPDMTTLSKALGNGWPIAAVLGKREIMNSGINMHYSATFHGDTGSMAAALKVIDILERQDVPTYVNKLGQLLIDGLNAAAQDFALPALAYAEPVPCMPFLSWRHPDLSLNALLCDSFYHHMLRGGILMHPRHLWFTSLAHTEEDIRRAVVVAGDAMQSVHRQYGHAL